MKKTIISVLLFSLVIGVISADEASERTAMKEHAKAQTMLVVRLAMDVTSPEDLAAHLRTSDQSGIKRHVATPDRVRQWFKDIDIDKIKIGRVDWLTDKNLVIVRMEEPIKCDLEFHIEGSTKSDLKLQAIHP